jgi:hypothetical protein
MIIAIIVVLLLIGGGAAYYFLIYKKSKKVEEAPPAEEAEPAKEDVAAMEVASGAGGTGTGGGGGSGGTAGASSSGTGGTSTPSPAIVPTDRQYSVLPNRDFWGNDLKYYSGEFSQCGKECDNTQGCIGYITNKPAGKDCWLKSAFDSSKARASNDRDTYYVGNQPTF